MFPGSTGARAAVYSSSQITRSISPASRPPYSLGHVMPTQPAACIVFCQTHRRSKVSRSDATRSSDASSRHSSGGRFVASQSRNSLRKLSCSTANSKSMTGRTEASRPALALSSAPDRGGPCKIFLASGRHRAAHAM